MGHFARDCPLATSGNSRPLPATPGSSGQQTVDQGVSQQVSTVEEFHPGRHEEDLPASSLLDCLLSAESEEDSEVCQVQIADRGSRQQYALV